MTKKKKEVNIKFEVSNSKKKVSIFFLISLFGSFRKEIRVLISYNIG